LGWSKKTTKVKWTFNKNKSSCHWMVEHGNNNVSWSEENMQNKIKRKQIVEHPTHLL
jgi:hypothetical protein